MIFPVFVEILTKVEQMILFLQEIIYNLLYFDHPKHRCVVQKIGVGRLRSSRGRRPLVCGQFK